MEKVLVKERRFHQCLTNNSDITPSLSWAYVEPSHFSLDGVCPPLPHSLRGYWQPRRWSACSPCTQYCVSLITTTSSTSPQPLLVLPQEIKGLLKVCYLFSEFQVSFSFAFQDHCFSHGFPSTKSKCAVVTDVLLFLCSCSSSSCSCPFWDVCFDLVLGTCGRGWRERERPAARVA